MKKKVFALMLICLAALMLGIGCTGSPDIFVPDPDALEFVLKTDSCTPHGGISLDVLDYDGQNPITVFVDGKQNGENIWWRDIWVPIDGLDFGAHEVTIAWTEKGGKTHKSAPKTFEVIEGLVVRNHYDINAPDDQLAIAYLDVKDSSISSRDNLSFKWVAINHDGETVEFSGKSSMEVIPVKAFNGYPICTLICTAYDGTEELYSTDFDCYLYLQELSDAVYFCEDTKEVTFSVESKYLDPEKCEYHWFDGNWKEYEGETGNTITFPVNGLYDLGEHELSCEVKSKDGEKFDTIWVDRTYTVVEKVPGTQKIMNWNGEIESGNEWWNLESNYGFLVDGYDENINYSLYLDGEKVDTLSIENNGRFNFNTSGISIGKHILRLDRGTEKGKTYVLIFTDQVVLTPYDLKEGIVPMTAEIKTLTPNAYEDVTYTWYVWREDMDETDAVGIEGGTSPRLDWKAPIGAPGYGWSVRVDVKRAGEIIFSGWNGFYIDHAFRLEGPTIVNKGERAVYRVVDDTGLADTSELTYEWEVDRQIIGSESAEISLDFSKDIHSDHEVGCLVRINGQENWCEAYLLAVAGEPVKKELDASVMSPDTGRAKPVTFSFTYPDGVDHRLNVLTAEIDGRSVACDKIGDGQGQFHVPHDIGFGAHKVIIRLHSGKSEDLTIYESSPLDINVGSSMMMGRGMGDIPNMQLFGYIDYDMSKEYINEYGIVYKWKVSGKEYTGKVISVDLTAMESSHVEIELSAANDPSFMPLHGSIHFAHNAFSLNAPRSVCKGEKFAVNVDAEKGFENGYSFKYFMNNEEISDPSACVFDIPDFYMIRVDIYKNGVPEVWGNLYGDISVIGDNVN